MRPALVDVRLSPGRLWHYCCARNLRWMNDSRVMKFLVSRGRYTWWDALRYYLRRVRARDLHYAIYAGSQHVGNCGLFDRKGASAELRLAIGEPNEWGKGIGDVVVKRLLSEGRSRGLTTIWLHVNPENGRAVHLYERNGFVCDGYATVAGAPRQAHMVRSFEEPSSEAC